MNKKICFVTTGDIKNNASSKRALGLANPLMRIGWEVSILMEDTEENHHRVNLECDSQIQVYYFQKGGILKERRSKNALIKKINPSYIYLCAFVVRNIVGIFHKSKKLVEHSELQSKIKDCPLLKKRITSFLELYSIFYADGILNASVYLQDFFKRRAIFLSKNIPMLHFPYAYSPDICKIAKSEETIVEKQEKDRFIVYLGSLTVNYGAMTMVKAFEILKKKQSHLKLLLLGKGVEYTRILNFIKEHQLYDTIYPMGYVEEENMFKYFSMADAFILPMHDTIQDWARCPSKLYMYLPYQKPIITCKIGEPYYLLKDKGLYFDVGDETSLAQTILDLYNSNNWTLTINSNDHNWEKRAKVLSNWICNEIP